MKDIILCDLDSTLADTRQRELRSPHTDPEATWLTYAQTCGQDALIEGTAGLLRILAQAGYEIWYVSGRGQDVYEETLEWLRRPEHKLPEVHSLRLYHKDEDHQVHVEYKRSVLHAVRKIGMNPILALDDWPSVRDMYQEEGVPCLLINPGYSDEPMKYFLEKGYVPK